MCVCYFHSFESIEQQHSGVRGVYLRNDKYTTTKSVEYEVIDDVVYFNTSLVLWWNECATTQTPSVGRSGSRSVGRLFVGLNRPYIRLRILCAYADYMHSHTTVTNMSTFIRFQCAVIIFSWASIVYEGMTVHR